MCIIVAKQNGVAFPSERVLKNCWDNNSDGAGFMYAYDGKVYISKGYMDYDEFSIALQDVRKLVGEDLPFVLHFRIATHGGVSQGCTHPFPVANNLGELTKLEVVTDVGFAHNGIMRTYSGGDAYSDTMDYVMSYLYPLTELAGRDVTSGNFMQLVDSSTEGCRFALLNGDGFMSLFGDYTEDDGIFYSNTSYSYEWWGSRYNSLFTSSKYESSYVDGLETGYISTGGKTNKELRELASDNLSGKALNNFLSMKPSKACNTCQDVAVCTDYGVWMCKDKEEAEDYIEYVRPYIMESEYEIGEQAYGALPEALPAMEVGNGY